MDEFEKSKRQLLDLLTANIEQETIDYVRQEMQQTAPESVPTANELRAYFQSPDERTVLSTYQQVLAMDMCNFELPSPGRCRVYSRSTSRKKVGPPFHLLKGWPFSHRSGDISFCCSGSSGAIPRILSTFCFAVR